MSWFKQQPDNKAHFSLHVSASNSYDTSTAKTVAINSETPLHISSDIAEVDLFIRIKGFVGSSEHASNSTSSSYFDDRPDTNISIQVNFTTKVEITGEQLLFGNDFGYPIRDFLPYGTSTGLKIFKSWVDPSVDGDLYVNDPFLYGKALSSFNVIEIGQGESAVIQENLATHEYDGVIPKNETERQIFFQNNSHLETFLFKPGKEYRFDFFSGLVSLKNSEFSIDLPGGYSLKLSSYLNEKFNRVRYVLKRGAPGGIGPAFGDPILVINFDLVPLDDTKGESTVDIEDESDELGIE